ncbi:MAG TPA: AtpZ/AtpI family protein [candidate division Zixibacteria bacterium]|nr:AtpZ/AtpI family protein [candidate division Zixibacteria bacterium]
MYLGIAFELPGTVLGGALVGYLADRYFDTSPWLFIAVTAVAFGGAMVRLVQWVRFFSGEDRERRGEENHPAD